MKAFIKDLKKNDKFQFNSIIYSVRKKYFDWQKNGEPYLKTDCGEIFYFDELEVEKILPFLHSKEDQKVFFEMIDKSPEPNQALVTIIQNAKEIQEAKEIENTKELAPEDQIKLLMEIVKSSRRLAYGVKNYLNEINADNLIMLRVLLEEYNAKTDEVSKKAVENLK